MAAPAATPLFHFYRAPFLLPHLREIAPVTCFRDVVLPRKGITLAALEELHRHSFAYIRNGYREILRIIAVEHAIKAQFCGCQFDLVDWEDAVLAIDRFQTSDNPKLPFDVIALRRQADAAETTLKEACTE